MSYTATHCNTRQHTATHCNTKLCITLKNTTARCSTLQHTPPHCTALHCNAPHCTTLHYTAPQCATLRYTTPHCSTLRHTAPHCTTLHHTAPHCATLHNTAQHCTTLHNTVSCCSTLQHAAARCSTLQRTTPNCSPVQNTAAHCTTLHHTATQKSHTGKHPEGCQRVAHGKCAQATKLRCLRHHPQQHNPHLHFWCVCAKCPLPPPLSPRHMVVQTEGDWAQRDCEGFWCVWVREEGCWCRVRWLPRAEGIVELLVLLLSFPPSGCELFALLTMLMRLCDM